MELFKRNSPKQIVGKDIPRKGTTIQVKPFDVDIVYAELTALAKSRVKNYHGPDSALYSAIYPLVCVTRLFGLAPYDFTADRMTVSNVYLVFSLAFLAIYSYIMYIVFLRLVSLKRAKSILSVVETTKVIVNYMVAMYELVSCVFRREKFVRIWNALEDYDERIARLGYPRDETRTGIAAWALLIDQTVIWILVNQSGMYAFMETWFFNVSYMCTYVGTAVSVYKFVGMVSFVGQRFHQLNRITRDNLPARVGYKSTTLSRKTIQELHEELMSIAEGLGSLYSWSLLFWLGNLSVHSVSNLYFICDWMIVTLRTDIAFPLIVNMSIWLIGFITQLLMVNICCDYAITEANSMGGILVEWDARVIGRFPHDDSVRASLYLLTRRLQFSAGGLFDVNLPLLFSIVSQLSTYLIILLQFPA
ncbi:PREDICTED: gustatory receptor 68a-like [Dufourea novaeangliae]|uniref:gustatory receptor 68a-like n=1 Tax=Dufourea novaeangliae TaxID=178035 RepID=UPI0007673FBB|nr:PREDICTED: gustatory receptor 68a-like [Dufourea novaeangliae]